MSKQFWGVIAVIILIFVGIFAINNNKQSNASGKTGTLTQHIEGSGTTGVTLVEYGDYQCPYCGQYFPIIKQVQSEFNDRIKFQFRNFPLVGVHQNAFAGARAAEAAAMQNKFWEMHDLLYEAQSQWSSASDSSTAFNQYAKQLGLNVTQFQTDYASSKVNDLINADMAEGNKLQVTGTPTFFLDGKKTQIGGSVAAFEKVINDEIAKKASGQSSAQTTSPAGSGTTSQTPAPAH